MSLDQDTLTRRMRDAVEQSLVEESARTMLITLLANKRLSKGKRAQYERLLKFSDELRQQRTTAS